MPVDDDHDDERVAALHQVLRTNGVGGPAPFTVEGEIAQMGHVGSTGIRGRGWRRHGARAMALLFLVTFGLAVLLEIGHLVRNGVG